MNRPSFDRGRPEALPVALLWALATGWAVLPLAPALARGEIPGSRYTDLYPSVWGLGWFAAQQPALPRFTTWLAAPEGMPFYYSSPLHGWAGWPLVAVGGAALAYVGTLILARLATVLVAHAALRALDVPAWGALGGALLYGASPFFQGYAVEGIVEGTDGWALPLWVWAVARRRPGVGAVAFALTVASSWYLGMVACLLAAGWGLRERRAWGTAAAGLVLAAPLLYTFLGAAKGANPLPDDIRAAMGAPLTWRMPALIAPPNIFAITSFTGASAVGLALLGAARRPGWAFGALACFVLSTGVGPWYDLPVLGSVRFPYRWHAGTLWCLAVVAGTGAGELRRRWVALLPFAEGLLLSPIPAALPGAPSEVPALYDHVRGPILLEVPGPVGLPPGEVNPSRPRARYLLYAQLHHGAASPWAPDFNGIGATPAAPWLASFAAWDPVVRRHGGDEPGRPDVAAARAAGVRQVMVHRAELGQGAAGFEGALVEAGARREREEGDLALYTLDVP